MSAISAQKGLIERRLMSQGLRPVGVDEVGRGCIAGPVYAACVLLDYDRLAACDDKTKALIRDSKTLSHNQRSGLLPILRELAIEHQLGVASVDEIETRGIQGATFLAMSRALLACKESFEVVLVDGNRPLPFWKQCEQRTIVGGDSLCFSIAAASIFAKEARDTMMREAANTYPGYGFDSHMGYGTKNHMDAIESLGITPLHRQNFAPIQKCLGRVPSHRRGEEMVRTMLCRRGWTIVEHNQRRPGSEIDLIVKKGPTLSFVEVKTRKRPPREASEWESLLPPAKRQALIRGAEAFLSMDNQPDFEQVRFDLALVVAHQEGPWEIEYKSDVFAPDDYL